MRVIEMSNKTYLVRHWFKWYRVTGSMGQWQYLFSALSWQPKAAIIKTSVTEDIIEKAARTLKAADK